MNERAFYAIVIAIVVVGGIGIGLAYDHQASTGTAASSGPFHLTLAIIPGLYFNSTYPDQPAYFIVNNGTLESSANISVPAHMLIDLTIVDYDSGPGTGTPPVYQNVSGTVGNVVYLFNSTLAQGGVKAGASNASISINSNTTKVISHMSIADIAHTLTVSSPGSTSATLNIPVGHGVEFAQFYVNVTGTYNWNCNVPCGTAAMETSGWMMGTFYVY
ncbi:MAG: hypothetical protein QW597_04625 [Thermoplasmataceae archaeon]